MNKSEEIQKDMGDSMLKSFRENPDNFNGENAKEIIWKSMVNAIYKNLPEKEANEQIDGILDNMKKFEDGTYKIRISKTKKK